jgi:hypothetical protein
MSESKSIYVWFGAFMLDFGVENYLEKSPQVGNSGIFLICFLMKNHCVSVGMRFSLNHV